MEVHLRTADGPVQGRCLHLEPDEEEVRASIEFPAERAPLLRLGEKIHLVFSGIGLPSPLVVEGRTVRRTDDLGHRSYWFRLREESKRSLMRLRNKRRAIRVSPKASEAVRIGILDVEGCATADVVLHDISATGLSMLVERSGEDQLFTRSQLKLSIQLSGNERPFEMIATIRHRRLFGAVLLYGLEFDSSTPRFEGSQHRISRYVTSLQTQELRRLRGNEERRVRDAG